MQSSFNYSNSDCGKSDRYQTFGLMPLINFTLIVGVVHITWVISHCMAWIFGMKMDDYKSTLYQKCLSEEMSIKIGDGKLRRQETQDSAFHDEPILKDKKGRFVHQETLEADFLDTDSN